MSRPITRCRECGGTHTPKCKPATRREEGLIWAGILASPEAQARRAARQAYRADRRAPFILTQTIAGAIVTITYDRAIDRFWLDVAGVRMAATHYSRAAAEEQARLQLATGEAQS